MGEMNHNLPQLAEAVRIWTGWGSHSHPNRNDERVIQHYGAAMAAKLLPAIKSLEDDFYSSDARFTAADLSEMGTRASEQFARKHPGIASDIVEALSWCYTFDYK